MPRVRLRDDRERSGLAGRRPADAPAAAGAGMARADGAGLRAADIARLQQLAGNQAVARMLGAGADRRTLQRLLAPGLVKAKGGAGLHKFKPGKDAGADTVRSGGVFGRGISETLPKGAVILVDTSKSDGEHVWADVDGRTGYVKAEHIEAPEQIRGSHFYVVPGASGVYRVWDAQRGDFLLMEKAAPRGRIAKDDEGKDAKGGALMNMSKADLVASFTKVLEAESATGVEVAEKRKLLEGIVHQVELAAIPDPKLWEMAAGNIATIKSRVEADAARLVAARLIGPDHRLKSVQFTGADFHKHGQAPFFLVFERPAPFDPSPMKLVYKPAKLMVDRNLFGRGNRDEGEAAPSLAEALDPAGGAISQYTIVAQGDAQGDYGYLEFVESEGPTTAADVEGIYRSLAANMALGFIVGLEDVHEENVLMLKDRVQVIDMEATTGQFKKAKDAQGRLDPSKGGFADQLWLSALNLGIKDKLLKGIQSQRLTALPDSGRLAGLLRTTFVNVLKKAAGSEFDEQFAGAKAKLATSRSRVVPVQTKAFYQLVQAAGRFKTLAAWQAEVDADSELVRTAGGGQGSPPPPAFLQRLLRSPGTYNALRRGEIPYYTRDLGSQRIFDEEENAIDATGFGKVGGPIDEQMQARRDELRQQGFGGGEEGIGRDPSRSDVVSIFERQIVPAIVTVNTELGIELAKAPGARRT